MGSIKICSSCKRKLPKNTDHFYKDKNRKDGLTYDCRECRGSNFTNKLKWKEGHRVCIKCEREILETTEYFRMKEDRSFVSICRECENKSNRQWRKNNPDWHKRYYENNKETILKTNMLWREQNEQALRENRKAYRQENKTKMLEYGRQYRKDNKGKIAIQAREWRKNNAEKIRIAKQRRNAGKKMLEATLTTRQWDKIKKDFNSSCAYCGISEETHIKECKERLHQDHFISLEMNGEYTHNNIIPACRKCNSSKHTRDFFEWYPSYEHYDKLREDIILEYLGYINKHIQQLALY